MFEDRELRQWLGMTAADVLVYLAALALVALFAYEDLWGDRLLAVGSIGLTLLACGIGWRHEPEFSDATNLLILVEYPLAVVLAVGLVVVHYLV
ncbi:MAG: hypothetical protein ACKV0T_01060 [Planctomycetales bacterium]